jgi:hypothetical protein
MISDKVAFWMGLIGGITGSISIYLHGHLWGLW